MNYSNLIGPIIVSTKPEDKCRAFMRLLHTVDTDTDLVPRLDEAKYLNFQSRRDSIVRALDRQAFGLLTLLNELAPPYCFFGPHPWNQDEYGYWVKDDATTLVRKDGGLLVHCVTEIPKKFSGYALVIQDGMTLYSVENENRELLWSV